MIIFFAFADLYFLVFVSHLDAQVNDVPLSPMTHEQAVIFLRQAADTVKLRLYRDVAQTPVAAMSPTNPEKGVASTLKSRSTFLRPEAINLLTDLAHRKHTPPCDSSGSSIASSNNNNNNNNSASNTHTSSSPRRLKRGTGKQPSHASSSGTGSGSSQNRTGSSKSGSENYVVFTKSSSSTSNCSDSEASTLSQNSFSIHPVTCGYISSGAEDTYTIVEDEDLAEESRQQEDEDRGEPESVNSDEQYYRPEEIQDGIEDDEYDVYDANENRANRPRFLNLGSSQSGSTPVVSRKPMFQFSSE